MTESEKNYVATVSAGHLKRYGQYFTSSFIADFMCAWACHGADSVLDPAVGNSVFLRCARNRIPTQYLIECICKSSDVRSPFLGKKDFSMLVRGGKKTYVLDVPRLNDVRVANYLSKGVAAGVDKKYLPSFGVADCQASRRDPKYDAGRIWYNTRHERI